MILDPFAGLDWYTVAIVWFVKSAINLIVQSLPRLENTQSKWGRFGIRAVHVLADNFPLAATGKPNQTPASTGKYLASKLLNAVKENKSK